MDVLNAEEEPSNKNIEEVVNYIAAMNYGLARLKEFPLSLRLIREIHAKLLRQGRGSHRIPGEFRTSQNWVGAWGSTIATASYVPPPVPEMKRALGDLELFIHAKDSIPALVKIGLIHAQFETIHPFLDGNGRLGRLLITFWLCQQEILSEPLLYLSYYFKQNRQEYYDRLMRVRANGDWEGWIKFFLKGICEVSDEAISSARQINILREECRKKLIFEETANHKSGFVLFDSLFTRPITTKQYVKELLGVTLQTATYYIDHFIKLGILQDYTPERKRKKRYVFSEYLGILERGTEQEN